MPFYAHISQRGPIKRGQVPGSIGVLETTNRYMPVGIAHSFGWDESGVSLWRLSVGGTELPGEWIIVDRKFRPAQQDGRQPR